MFRKIKQETLKLVISTSLDISKGIMGFGGVSFFVQDGDLTRYESILIILTGLVICAVMLVAHQVYIDSEV